MIGNETRDVVVVGAGPAGALAARALARRGLDVLLLERRPFPRDKVCGGCLGRVALDVLAAEGLGHVPDALGAEPLTRIRLAGWGRSALVPLPEGRAVSRSALDRALVDAALADGVTFRDGAHARLVGDVEGTPRVAVRRAGVEHEIEARVVVAADGLGGTVSRGHPSLAGVGPSAEGTDAASGRTDASLGESRGGVPDRVAPGSRVGLGARLPPDAAFAPHTVHMAVDDDGYVGIVRVEDGGLNVAAAVDAAALARGVPPAAVVARILRRAGLPAPDALHHAPWRGTPPLTRRPGGPSPGCVFRLGDAAGYVEPFTGEGMGWALAGARALAPLALEAARTRDASLVRRWEDEHRRTVGRAQRLCRWTALALRSPSLARAALMALGAFPGLARPFVRTVSTSPAPLLSPTS